MQSMSSVRKHSLFLNRKMFLSFLFMYDGVGEDSSSPVVRSFHVSVVSSHVPLFLWMSFHGIVFGSIVYCEPGMSHSFQTPLPKSVSAFVSKVT